MEEIRKVNKKTIYILENKMFNELVNFSFEEMKNLFSYGKLFFPLNKHDEIREKVRQLDEVSNIEINKINEYERGEFQNIIKANDEVCFDEEPAYMYGIVQLKYKNKIISIIKEYFDDELFNKNKNQMIMDNDKGVEEVSIGQLDVYLSRLGKTKIYGFLSIVGYYQRRRNYFLNKSAIFDICWKYSNEVNYVNKALGINNEFHYIFGKWGRIEDKYIDIDYISLKNLVLPYFKNNVNELIEISKIIIKGFSQRGGNNNEDSKWKNIQLEVAKYINVCETKGLIKEVY